MFLKSTRQCPGYSAVFVFFFPHNLKHWRTWEIVVICIQVNWNPGINITFLCSCSSYCGLSSNLPFPHLQLFACFLVLNATVLEENWPPCISGCNTWRGDSSLVFTLDFRFQKLSKLWWQFQSCFYFQLKAEGDEMSITSLFKLLIGELKKQRSLR